MTEKTKNAESEVGPKPYIPKTENELRRLEQGWKTTWLRIPNGPQLAFLRPVRVRLTHVPHKRWIAEIPELHASESGPDLAGAIGRLVERLRDESSKLVRALTHRLSASDRLRKQQLLGTVDIVTSGLQVKVPEHVWAGGELELVGEQIAFRTWEGSLHELGPAVRESIEFERHFRFAKFATDSIGRPRGPVISLSDPFRGDARELLEELRRKRASG